MKKLALAVAAVVIALIPVSADAAPTHHDQPPVSSRAIDWD